MKGFAISLILLAVIIIMILINAFYIKSTLDKLERLAQGVWSERTPEAVSSLMDYWEKHRATVALSVSLREIDRVTENLLCLQAACIESNEVMMKQSYSLFINALDDIKRYERISVINIF